MTFYAAILAQQKIDFLGLTARQIWQVYQRDYIVLNNLFFYQHLATLTCVASTSADGMIETPCLLLQHPSLTINKLWNSSHAHRTPAPGHSHAPTDPLLHELAPALGSRSRSSLAIKVTLTELTKLKAEGKENLHSKRKIIHLVFSCLAWQLGPPKKSFTIPAEMRQAFAAAGCNGHCRSSVSSTAISWDPAEEARLQGEGSVLGCLSVRNSSCNIGPPQPVQTVQFIIGRETQNTQINIHLFQSTRGYLTQQTKLRSENR